MQRITFVLASLVVSANALASEKGATQPTSAPAAAAPAAAAPAAAPSAEKIFTMEDLAKHNTKEDCWLLVNGKVYDVTKSIPKHKGGSKAIVNNCGTEATKAFETQGGKGKHSAKAKGYLEGNLVGELKK